MNFFFSLFNSLLWKLALWLWEQEGSIENIGDTKPKDNDKKCLKGLKGHLVQLSHFRKSRKIQCDTISCHSSIYICSIWFLEIIGRLYKKTKIREDKWLFHGDPGTK